MKKKYESFEKAEIELFAKKDDETIIFVKDTVNNVIICRKHINYINKIGLDLNVPYKVDLGIYTNERGYTEYDFLHGKIYSYNRVQSGKSAPVKKSSTQAPKTSKTSANKPAWLK